ncbi:hypothetical protein tb265_24390 [Gemmatimonadetes bacterium T265]|nr:hypothetical protein tb265_24390 [Gemmatimonadetes bacterium T265]
MDLRTICIRSLGELIDHVTPDEPDPVSGRRRDSGVYRGVGDSHWPMLTSLDRLGGVDPPHTKCGLEEHVLRNFIRYSRPHVARDLRNDWELLATAQHHGVPTRLLDWSYSPFVAAHFATLGRREALGEGRPDRVADREARDHGAEPPPDDAAQGEGPGRSGRDRVIWRLDWQRVHDAFALPPLALLAADLDALRGARDFTPWALMARGGDVAPFACLFEPPTLDARIAAQSAVFTLCSDTSRAFDVFLDAHGLADALTRLVVPAADVARVRDQLDLVTIDERRLFPDLDGVATRLRRYYS